MVRSVAPHQVSAHPPRRRRASIAIGGAAAAMLLSACGVVAAFVPPLSVGDPLGVDGQLVTATLQDGAIETQSIAHIDVTRTLDVPDLEANLRGFGLAGFHTNAGLADEVVLRGPVGGLVSDYPASITVTRALVEAELWDDVNGRVAFTHDVDLALSFDRTDCTLDGCAYAYTGTEPLTSVLDLELTDRGTLETLVAILVLRQPETPNQGTFRVAIEVASDTSLSGYAATFRLTSQGSTIRLGG